MILPIVDVLSEPELRQICAWLAQAPRQPGAITAGWAAMAVKRNAQFDPEHVDVIQAHHIIEAAIARHPLITIAARPKRFSPVLLNAYEHGAEYGWHVDDAHMDGLRTDLSYTLFLSHSDSYVGGELSIKDLAGEQAFKLPAGGLILYPASTVHCVTPVTQGLRLAAVGWIESYVAEHDLREWLFALDITRRELHQQAGNSDAFLRLSQVHGAMLRKFAR